MKRKQLILLADDDRETRRMLNRILELEGYTVVVATDGSSAVALLEDYGPDLIILDINPDGFQVLNLIRQRSNVPVIILTARCEVTILCSALILGADDYVTKPFHTREFLARIRAKLRRATSQVGPAASQLPPRFGMVEERQRTQPPFTTTKSGKE